MTTRLPWSRRLLRCRDAGAGVTPRLAALMARHLAAPACPCRWGNGRPTSRPPRRVGRPPGAYARPMVAASSQLTRRLRLADSRGGQDPLLDRQFGARIGIERGQGLRANGDC